MYNIKKILIKLSLIIIFHLFIYVNLYKTIKIVLSINNVNDEEGNKSEDFFRNSQAQLQKKVYEIFSRKGSVNINIIEEEIKKIKNKLDLNIADEMNIGFQIDHNYTLPAMITIASIMDSQNKNTYIRFHFAVVLDFTILDMIKIYSLRKKINNNTEFNFYNASKVEKDLNGLNIKGAGAVAKLLLPQLLPDDVKKLLVFDTGDLLVLRDIREQYNWDMKDFLYVGVPGGKLGRKSLITNQIYENYINIGSFLINVTKVKSENMYEKFVRYKNFYHSHIGDQDLLNDISMGKVGMYPIKFGFTSPFINDYIIFLNA